MAKRVTRSVSGGPVGWNLCKLEMNKSIKQLEKTLGHPEKIPRDRRAELRITLKLMKGMAKVANSIGCAGPFMSFDLQYATRENGLTRTTTPRKRR
jgi:hypothetical protein